MDSAFYKPALHATKFSMDSEKLRKELREYKERESLTIVRMAFRMGLSKSFLDALMNGRRLNIGAASLARIAVVTGCRMEDFIVRFN